MTRQLRGGRESCQVKKSALFGEILLSGQSITLMFRVSRRMNSRFQSKTQRQMFVLSSGRHVGVHGGSTQSSITLGKSILQVSLKRKIVLT